MSPIDSEDFAALLGFVVVLGSLPVLWTTLRQLRSARHWRETSDLISERSQNADDQFEKALLALQRMDAESRRKDEAEEARQQDEAMVLAKLWASVNRRIDKYHDDAQNQGRQAFLAAMMSMWIGFALLIASGVAALVAPTATGVVVSGSLGAVSAAVSGYVARTFLRTHQETSFHLRNYFLHPVEMSRYLSAERAIGESGLDPESRAELMRILVHSMVTGSLADGAAGGSHASGSAADS